MVFDDRFNLLEVLLVSVVDVAIVICDRALFRLAPVLFRSFIIIKFEEFSLRPFGDKSFGVFRDDRVRT